MAGASFVTGAEYWEWKLDKQNLSWKEQLKRAIDEVIKVSEDFEDFLAKCADFGILVDYNPDHKIDLKFMLAEQKERNPRAKFTRAKTLNAIKLRNEREGNRSMQEAI